MALHLDHRFLLQHDISNYGPPESHFIIILPRSVDANPVKPERREEVRL